MRRVVIQDDKPTAPVRQLTNPVRVTPEHVTVRFEADERMEQEHLLPRFRGRSRR